VRDPRPARDLGRGRERPAPSAELWGGVVRPAPSAELWGGAVRPAPSAELWVGVVRPAPSAEFRHLFDIAGFRLGRIVPTKAEVNVIEGGKVR
jgi:hypothetical protein